MWHERNTVSIATSLLSVNAIHGIGQIQKSLEVSVCPNTIATAVFVRSSSNLKRRSHI